jgi:hypothetical protein
VARDEAVADVQVVALAQRGTVSRDALEPERDPLRKAARRPLDKAAGSWEQRPKPRDDALRSAELGALAGKVNVEQGVGGVGIGQPLELGGLETGAEAIRDQPARVTGQPERTSTSSSAADAAMLP